MPAASLKDLTVKSGAIDYLSKPADADDVARALLARKDEVRDQLTIALVEAINVPNTMIEILHKHREEQRNDGAPDQQRTAIAPTDDGEKRDRRVERNVGNKTDPADAVTLAEWRVRFRAAWPQLIPLGFDERFLRIWEFYLAYCEAAFEQHNTDVLQFTLVKP